MAQRMAWLLLVVMLAGACTTEIYAPAAQNPPPTEPFQSFGQFRLEAVTLSDEAAKHGYNQSARAAIERNLNSKMTPLLASWDRGQGRTLLIEPHIEEIKFVGGAARVWAGGMAGSSAVVMRVDYRDAGSGATIASPVFYQHAAAMGGAWTFGATDNAMLVRIAELVTQYTQANYPAAVGGPTGAPSDRVSGAGS